MLVFDEADRMLSIGFYPDMKEVQRYLPKKRIHTCLFSATYPPHVLKLAAEFMSEPALLSLSQKEVHVAEVQHLFCEVKPMDKDRALVRLLETENPASAIIFCNTKANVHYVTGVLQGFGYSADELSADLSQNRREAVLDKSARAACNIWWLRTWPRGALIFRPCRTSFFMSRRRTMKATSTAPGARGAPGLRVR